MACDQKPRYNSIKKLARPIWHVWLDCSRAVNRFTTLHCGVRCTSGGVI